LSLGIDVACVMRCQLIVNDSFSARLTGQFTLRDMYEQFQNIMKMGPFGQIMVNIYCVYVPWRSSL